MKLEKNRNMKYNKQLNTIEKYRNILLAYVCATCKICIKRINFCFILVKSGENNYIYNIFCIYNNYMIMVMAAGFILCYKLTPEPSFSSASISGTSQTMSPFLPNILLSVISFIIINTLL